MSESTTNALEQAVGTVSEAASQAADDFSNGVNEAIKDNQFLAFLKELFEKYTAPSNLIGLAAKILIAALILFAAYLLAKFI